MPAIVGYLDARLRPRANLHFENGFRIDVLIDAGFSGQLFMGEQTARRVGVTLMPLWRNVTVAGGGQPVRR